MNFLIERIFKNPKTTITGLGLAATIVAAEASSFPKLQALAAAAAGLSAAYHFLAAD